MKLQAVHSGYYLTLNVDQVAIQHNFEEAKDWLFLSNENNNEILWNEGGYGRLVLSGTEKCLQPDSLLPHEGWLVRLAPIQRDNESQLWKFVPSTKKSDTYFIENKLSDDASKKRCLDVCGARPDEGSVIITYHEKLERSNSVGNQWWLVI